MSRRYWHACWRKGIFAIGVLSVLANAASVWAGDGLQPCIDAAQFFDSEHNSYIEIYYSLAESGITYRPEAEGGFGCQLVLGMEIYFKDELWANKVWKVEKTLPDTSAVNESAQLVDLVRYFVDEAGDYRVLMHVRDMYDNSSLDSVTTVLRAEPFKAGGLVVSDVELASHIEKAGADNAGVFVKNTYEIMPSPGAIFGRGAFNLYYYFEVYNLFENISAGTYKSVYKVTDIDGREVGGRGFVYRTKKRLYDTSMEIGMVNLSDLPSGKYRLVYGIADDSKTLLASREKLFYVYNPDVVVDETTAPTDSDYGFLGHLSEEELDEEFERLLFLSSKEERTIYRSLQTVKAKREFLASVWLRPNEDNLPPQLFREQYLGRVRYADERFKSVYSPGWRSDRGRVFVLYGVPSNIERFASSESTVPYQTWTFDELRGQGGVIFVFADQQGFSRYELIHSTLRGEISDVNWKSQVFRGSNESVFR